MTRDRWCCWTPLFIFQRNRKCTLDVKQQTINQSKVYLQAINGEYWRSQNSTALLLKSDPGSSRFLNNNKLHDLLDTCTCCSKFTVYKYCHFVKSKVSTPPGKVNLTQMLAILFSPVLIFVLLTFWYFSLSKFWSWAYLFRTHSNW